MSHKQGFSLPSLTAGGQPRRIDVPVEVPEGMDRDAIFGDVHEVTVGLRKKPGFINHGSANKSVSGNIVRGNAGSGAGGGALIGVQSRLLSAAPSSNLPAQTSAARKVFIDAEPSPPPKPSAEESRRQELRAKGDSVLVSLVERFKKNATADPAEFRFVSDGKAEIQIWLVEKSAKTIAELKALGFEVLHDAKASTLVIGRIPINKLEALLDLKNVRYVAPLMKY